MNSLLVKGISVILGFILGMSGLWVGSKFIMPFAVLFTAVFFGAITYFIWKKKMAFKNLDLELIFLVATIVPLILLAFIRLLPVIPN